MSRETGHGLALGVSSLLASTAAALGLLHLCDLLYRLDVWALRLPEMTGLSKEVILRNYHAMMDYLSPLSTGEFSLPDLAFSAQGAAHFADCRRLFAAVYLMGIAAAAMLLLLRKSARRRPVGRRTFFIAAGTLAGCLVLVTAALAVDAPGAFLLFHKLFFRNDYWLFDPLRDPVILLLPQQFFFHCAGVFVLFWGVTGLALWRAGAARKGISQKR